MRYFGKEFEELEALERIKKSHHTAIAVMGCERDIETENAIDIIEKTLETKYLIEKALIKGIWNGVPEHIQSVGLVYMLGTFYLTCFDENGKSTGSYPLSEYKITWWLRKDKSE